MKRRAAWSAAAVLVAAAIAGVLIWSPWSAAEPSLSQAEAESRLLKMYAGEIESSRRSGDLYEMQLRTETGVYEVILSAADGRVESIRQLEAAPAAPPEIVGRETILTRLEQQAGIRVEKLELEAAEGERRLYVAELKAASGERRRLEIDAYTGETLTDRVLETAASGADTPSGDNAGSAGGGADGKPGQSAGEAQPDKPARLLTESQAKASAAEALGAQIGAVEDSDAELRREEDGQAYYLVDVELNNGRKAEVQINAVSGAMQTITWDEEEADPPPSQDEETDEPDEDEDDAGDDSGDEDDGDDENT